MGKGFRWDRKEKKGIDNDGDGERKGMSSGKVEEKWEKRKIREWVMIGKVEKKKGDVRWEKRWKSKWMASDDAPFSEGFFCMRNLPKLRWLIKSSLRFNQYQCYSSMTEIEFNWNKAYIYMTSTECSFYSIYETLQNKFCINPNFFSLHKWNTKVTFHGWHCSSNSCLTKTHIIYDMTSHHLQGSGMFS